MTNRLGGTQRAKPIRFRSLLERMGRWAAGLFMCFSCSWAEGQTSSLPTRYMVATVNPIATAAGLSVFREGGNAVDAAITAALTLGVVDGFNSGIGGGCFILIRTSRGELIAIDARETAPQAAWREMYLQAGRLQPDWAQSGPLAVATPGALAGYAEAIRRFGKLGLARALQPGIELAANGFDIDAAFAARIREDEKDLRKFSGPMSPFFDAEQRPLPAGALLKQVDLARTYQQIAQHGTPWFYHGEFAEKVDLWMRSEGGILRRSDFRDYQIVDREPLITQFRDWQIVGFPPPSSGGVHVAQILNILESFDFRKMYERDPAEATHILAEAMKMAFADRAHWLGDPDFVPVPKGIIDKEYARNLAARIDLQTAAVQVAPGQPPRAELDSFQRPKHTTHIAAADSEGNWVALTTTVNTSFGSKVIVPGTGVLLNNQMDDFAIAPGQPNSFGLVGGDANAVAPGKRPLSSMSPTLVLRDGQPILTVGAAGGPRIISATLQTIVRHLELGWPMDRALASPRVHHQWMPPELLLEEGFDPQWAEALAERGHSLRTASRGSMAVAQAISFDPQTGTFRGAADPRVNGAAAGD